MGASAGSSLVAITSVSMVVLRRTRSIWCCSSGLPQTRSRTLPGRRVDPIRACSTATVGPGSGFSWVANGEGR